MTDKVFHFSKTVFDTLINNSIEYSTDGQLYLSISQWENVPALLQTTIIAQALSFGWIED